MWKQAPQSYIVNAPLPSAIKGWKDKLNKWAQVTCTGIQSFLSDT